MIISYVCYAQSGWFWQNNIPSGFYRKIIFVNDSVGFINGVHPNVACWKTIDKGLTWNTFDIPGAGTGTYCMYFLNENTGWISGNGLFKTTNGALSWNVQNIPISTDGISTVYFLDQFTGFVSIIRFSSQTEGILFRTSDSGQNWINIYNQMFTEEITFIDSKTGFACGYDMNNAYGIVRKTTNAGITWYTSVYPVGMTYTPSIFFTGDTGYLCNNVGKIYQSNDTGETWTLSSTLGGFSLHDIYFINPDTGWTVGYGAICRTTNSGINWQNQIEGPSWFKCSSVYFLNALTGFVISESWLLKTTTGGGLITGNTTSILLPTVYSLSQNYPNPFNPQTKIKFAVPKASFTKLIVYDLLGGEVTTLVNEELRPGTYEADWDGSNYSSGVYFYKLMASDFSETKKMVLMK